MSETEDFEIDVNFSVKNKYYGEGKRLSVSAAGVEDCMVLAYLGKYRSRNQRSEEINYDLLSISRGGLVNVISLKNETDIPGMYPAIAASPSSNIVVLVSSERQNVYYSVGILDSPTIKWLKKGVKFSPSDVYNTTIAISSSNVVMAFFESSNYYIGQLFESSGEIQWKSSEKFPNNICLHSPSVSITSDDQVVLVHTKTDHWEGSPLCYSIGKLNSQAKTVEWLTIGKQYFNFRAKSPSVAVTSFGEVMQVHHCAYGDSKRLYYRLGSLSDKDISWRGTSAIQYYDHGIEPILTRIPFAANVITEFHTRPASDSMDYFNMNSILFNTELVDIEYESQTLMDGIPFATAQTIFGSFPHNVKQVWNIKESYSCTNTYSWQKSTHTGISVSAGVSAEMGFLSASLETTAEMSVDVTVGKQMSVSRTRTWSQSITVKVPGNESDGDQDFYQYTAVLTRLPSKIPFTATYKRGDIQWKQKGSVEVSHGSILANITSKKIPKPIGK